MFCAIWIEPINLTSARKVLQVVVSQRPLDKITPLNVANPMAEEIVSGFLCLLHAKNSKQRETTLLKRAPVAQIKMISSLNNHRAFGESGILQRKSRLLDALATGQSDQSQCKQ